MEERNRKPNSSPEQIDPVDYTNDPSGVFVQNRPADAERPNESRDHPGSAGNEPGDTLRLSNNRGNNAP